MMPGGASSDAPCRSSLELHEAASERFRVGRQGDGLDLRFLAKRDLLSSWSDLIRPSLRMARIVTGAAIRGGDHWQAVKIDLTRSARQPIPDRLGQAAKVTTRGKASKNADERE